MVKPSLGPNGSGKIRWVRMGLLLRTRKGWLLRDIISMNGLIIKKPLHMLQDWKPSGSFLDGKILEEVYVQQPPRFESSEFPNHVCKLDKALYGLKQALRDWYETLSNFLIHHKFVRGTIDNTLFTYKTKSDVIIVQ
ncbi:retrovirus-related pol polyprotein from transposon TNT 1-94, partial [Tanacetum coccineum]